MDFSPMYQALTANTQALNAHTAAIEKLINAAVGQQSASGEAQPAKRGPGRPPKSESAPATTSTASQISGTNLLDSSASSVAVSGNATSAVQQSVAVKPATGTLSHKDLALKFLAYAKQHGRDKIMALLNEFGATEFGKVKAEDLPLFNDRLDGKPQTPVDGSDLLGLGA